LLLMSFFCRLEEVLLKAELFENINKNKKKIIIFFIN